jgi:cobalt/nickel transport system permease protein
MRQTLHSSSSRRSFATSLDPRWKLVTVILAIIATALLQTAMAAAVALLGALALAAVARVPVRGLMFRLSIVAVFLIAFTIWLPFSFPNHGSVWTIGPVTVSSHGLAVGARIWFKALAIVTLVLALAASTPFPALLQAARAIHFPGILVQLVALTHRYVVLLADELARLRVALRVRGYRNRANFHSYRTVGHVAGILLVRGIERAERVSQAMLCRGFDGQFRSLNTFRSRSADFTAFLAVAIPTLSVLAWDVARR